MNNEDIYLKNIERDLNSIDRTLGRIADALEKLTAIQYIVDNVDPCEKGGLKEPDKEQHCPFEPIIICSDVNDPDECNSKCMYFEEY